MPAKKATTCQMCKSPFQARRGAKTCSPACRKRLERNLKALAAQKAARLESALGKEFHRIAAALMANHVAHTPYVLADERGSIAVSTATPPTNTQLADHPDPVVPEPGAAIKPSAPSAEPAVQTPPEPVAVTPEPAAVTPEPLAVHETPVVEPESLEEPAVPAAPEAQTAPAAPAPSASNAATSIAPAAVHLEDVMSTESLEPSAFANAEGVEPVDGSQQPAEKAAKRDYFSLFRFNKMAFVGTGVALLLLIGGGGSFFAASRHNANPAKSPAERVGSYAITSLPLGGVKANPQLEVGGADQLTINGQLTVNDTLVISPTSTPTAPTTGQIYYNQANNVLYYYNGTQFVSLVPEQGGVTSIGGLTGAVGLGNGLSAANNQISLSDSVLQDISNAGKPRVDSLQGQTGDLTLAAGPGISINGLTITNSGVLSLAGTANQISVSSGTGDITLTLPQDIAVTSTPTFGGLTLNGGLSVTSGGANITGDSTLTGNLTNTGNLAVQGSGGLTLGVAGTTPGLLKLANGTNSNLTVLQAAAPTGVGNATYNLPSIAGTTSDEICLVTLGNCGGSGGGVTTPGGTAGYIPVFTGAQTIANSILSQSGTTLTVGGNVIVNAANGFVGNLLNLEVNSSSKLTVDEDGSTIQAGTLTVNGTGASLVAGSLSVGTGLTVTTGGANITGTTAITGNGTITGTLAVQGANALTLGTASTNTGAIIFKGSGGNGTLTLQGPTTPSVGNYTLTIPAINANANVCTDNSICSGYAPAGGSNSYIQNGVALQAADFNISGTGIAGTLNATSAIQLGGANINTGGTLSNVAYLDQANNFSAANTFSAVGTALSVTNNAFIGGTLAVTGTINTATISGGTLSGGNVSGGTLTGTAVNSLNVSGTAISGTGALTIDANGANTVSIGGISTGDVLLAGGSGATGCTVTNVTGALACTGNINSTAGALQTAGVTRIDNSGNATLGTVSSGLINGQTISSTANFTGTLAVQGASVSIGNAGATAGSLYLANASNSNLSILQATAPTGSGNATYTLPSIAGGSSDEICTVAKGNCAGSGSGVTTPGGTSGTIALFTGAQSIGNSVITQSGSAITVAGTLVATGANSLTLGTASANTGAILLKNSSNANTLTLQAGATGSNLTLTLPTADGANGDCLQTNASGVLSFNSCTGGPGGGVTSLDGLTGVLTINNSSGSGSAITINNASTSQKGIAQFNSTNFSDNGAGTINTIQDIATTSSPVFVSPNGTTGINTGVGAGTQRIDASGNLVNIGTITSGLINGQTISSSANFTGTVAIQGASSLSLGTASTNRGAIAFYNSAGANTITLQGPAANPGGNYTLTIPTLTGNDTLCVAVLANCTAIGAAGGDLTGSYPNPTIAKLQGTTLTISSLASGDVLQYNGSAIVNGHITNSNLTAGAFSNITGVGALTSGSIASGFGTISTASSISTTSSLHGDTLTAGSSNQFQVDASGNLTITNTASIQGSSGLTLGVASTTDGLLSFANSSNSNLTVIQAAAPTGSGNANITIPAVAGGSSDTVCLVTLGNCAGSGTGVTTPGGTNGTIAMFTGSQVIANSILTQSGTTLTVAGNQIVNAANGFTGNLINLEVNSSSKLTVNESGNITTAGTLTVNGTGASSFAGALTVSGAITASTLGSADTTTVLCRNSANQIATCAGTGSGSPFVQGGNSFGATATLGTNDSNSLTFETNNTTQATIAVGGATTFKNSANSTTAFQIQNASAQTVLVADTTNQRVAIGPAAVPANSVLTIGTSTTTAAGGITFGADASANLYRLTTATLQTDGSLSVIGSFYAEGSIGVELLADNDYRVALSQSAGGASKPGVVFGSGSGATDVNLYRSSAGVLKTDAALVVGTLGSGGNVALCSNAGQIGTCSTGAGSPFVQGGNSFGATATLGTNDSNSLTFETNNTTQATIAVGGATTFQNSANSTTAFQVQKSDATPLFVVDTTNSRVAVGPSAVPANGALTIGTNTTTAAGGLYFGTDVSLFRNGTTTLQVGGNLVVSGPSNSDALFVQTGSTFTTIDAKNFGTGNIFVGENGTGTVFSIGNGGSVLSKSLTNSTTAFQIQNASAQTLFVANTTAQQVAVGPAAVPANSVLTVGTSTTAASGGITFGADTSANLYRSAAATLKTDGGLIVGTLGTGGNVALCSNAGQIGTCSTGSGSPFVQGGNSFGATAVLGTNDSNSLTFETNNTTQATIAVGGATTFKNSANSTTAFQIQKADATPLFVVDTTNGQVAVGPSGVPANGVLTVGTNTTAATGGLYFGTDTNLYRQASGVLQTNGKLFLQPADIAAIQEVIRIVDPGVGFSEGGYIRFDTGDQTDQARIGIFSLGSPNGSGLRFYTNSTNGSSAAQVVASLSSTGAALFQNSTNSTTAFQIQKSDATPLFVVDTTNSRLAVGPSAVPANGVLTIGTNTTTAAGGIYFGTDTDLYRVAAGYLKTDGVFQATGGINAYGNSSVEKTSTTAFQIQNNAGTGNLFVADTTNTRIGLGIAPATTSGLGLLQVGAASSTTAAQGISFGNDTSANLYRSAAATLKTDGGLIVGTLGSGGNVALCSNAGQIGTCSTGSGSPFVQGGNSFGATATLGTNDNNNLNIRTNSATVATFTTAGQLRLPTTGGTGGLLIGGDGTLYRFSSTALATDNDFIAGHDVQVRLGSANQVVLGLAGPSSEGGIKIGSAGDTNLYRLSAGVLKTDGGLTVAGTLSSPGAGANSEHFGAGSSAAGSGGVALGASASAAANGSIAIGNSASAGNVDSITIGLGATSTSTNQLVIGATTHNIQDVYIGNGVTYTAPTGFTLHATGVSTGTSNTAGASLSLAGGIGTGTGNGGDINFQIAKPGSTGSTQNTLATVASLSGVDGKALFKNSANSTTAFQIQKADATPLFVVDTTNGQVAVGPSGVPANGVLTVGTNTTAATGGLYFGTDTNLYRNGTSLLQTDSRFLVNASTAGTALFVQTNTSSTALNAKNYGSGSIIVATNNTADVFSIANNGTTLFKTSGDSTTSFRVQDSGGFTTFDVDNTNNRVGIGVNVTPSYTLDVQRGSSSTYAARIYNTDSSNTADGLLISLAVANASRGTGNYFIGFSTGDGTVAGKIQGGASAVAYTTTAADYAEYFLAANPADKPQSGEIVSLASADKAVQKAQHGVNSIVGVISDNPGFLGNGPICQADDNNCESDYGQTNVIVGMTGQLPVKVSAENGAISTGDAITIGSTPGVGVKATGSAQIVGYAMESFSGAGTGTIKVYINPGHYNGPDNVSYLQNGGDATLANLNVTGTADFTDLNVSGTATIHDLAVTGTATIATLHVTGGAEFAGNITVGGHIITAGGQPTTEVQAAAGGSASVSVDGTDTTGTITITTGSAPSAGALAKILFSKTYGQAPHIVLSASNDNAASLKYFKGATSLTDFMFNAQDNPAPNTVYKFDYFIAQ